MRVCEHCNKRKATWTAYRDAGFGVIVWTKQVCGWCKRKLGGY